MTEIDFLPEWYQVRQQRRQGYVAFIWLGGVLLGLMCMSFYLGYSQVRQCRADIQQLQAKRTAVNEQLVKIDKMRSVRDDLTRKSAIAEKLHNRPDVIHVLGRLVELLPPEINLVDLEMVAQVPPAAAVAVEPATGPRRVTGAAAEPSAADGSNDEKTNYKLKILGVAAVDASIGNFIARLVASDSFVNVQMVYSRDVKRSGRLMRQFELTCQIPDEWQMSASLPQVSQAEGNSTEPTP